MCGTYTLRYDTDDINAAFGLNSQITWSDSFKIAPSTLNPVIVRSESATGEVVNKLKLLKWGFRPHWMTDQYMKNKKRYPFINARAETLFSTPAFRGAARSSRCLIVADGFYEPKGAKTVKKRPYHFFQFTNQRLFAFAGVTTCYHDETIGTVNNYAIITVPPNNEVAPVHDRMPLILHTADYDVWLNQSTELKDLQTLMAPWSGAKLESWGVTDYVKKRDAYGSDCIARIDDNQLF